METKTFAELGLSAKVQAAVEASGYTTPTPIQATAIPIAVTGQDVLGIAQTGTGKTASFTLPMITRLEIGRARARMPRSLILAPTRELAAQVAQSFEKYGVNHKLNVALLIGGVSMDDQVKKLDRGADVLIATPGRLLDHFQRGRLMLMGVEILVIDEADRMLDMGFIPDIEKICKLLPPKRQTLFFSATMPPEITRLVDQFLTNPQRVEATRPATTATTITQRFQFCPEGTDWSKRDVLRKLIREDGVRNAIIFANRKVEVAILLKSLLKHGFNAGALHGDMDQKSRMETLDKFRSGAISLLAASDVAARGLDIPDVSHVFNYDLPRDSDDYVHRIGRTGRAGKEGSATSLVTREDLGKSLKDIEKIIGEPAVWLGEAPTEDDFATSGKRRGRGGGRGQEARGGGSRESGGGRGGRDRQRGGSQQAARGEERRGNGGERGGERAEPQPRAAQLDPPVREAREPRGPAPKPQQQQPRGEDRQRSPRGGQQDDRRPQRAPQDERPQRAEQGERQQSRSRQDRAPRRNEGDRDQGQAVGFADNVPAFLRRSSRPVKVASE